MTQKWRSNKEATDRVITLLTGAGLPLQTKVSQICRQFVQHCQDTDNTLNCEYGRIIYNTKTGDIATREIDQSVTIAFQVEVTDKIIIHFSFEIPIECKHRDDVEIFGFPSDYKADELDFPVVSYDLVGANIIHNLNLHRPIEISNITVSDISLLEIIKGGEQPQKVFKENLAYNAGRSLYDYIFHNTPDAIKEDTERIVDELDVFKRIIKMGYSYQSIHRHWQDIRYVFKGIDEDTLYDFNHKYLGNSTHGFVVEVFVPILCMDSPIFNVKMSEEGNIASFEDTNFLIHGIRIPPLEDITKFYVENAGVEYPIIITNHLNLYLTLNYILHWATTLRSQMLNATKSDIDLMIIESAIFKRLVTASENLFGRKDSSQAS